MYNAPDDDTPPVDLDAVDEIYSRANIINDARQIGLDLYDPEETLRCIAIGLTVNQWRNGPLESLHATSEGFAINQYVTGGIDTRSAETWDEAAYDTWRNEHQRLGLIDEESVARLGPADDLGEIPRLAAIAKQAKLGFGVPQDVMMRMNIATTSAVLEILQANLEIARLHPDDTSTWWFNRRESSFEMVVKALRPRTRKMQIGSATLSPKSIFPDFMLDSLAHEQRKKAKRLWMYESMLDYRRFLWALACFGASYASHWWGTPWWPDAVDLMHSQVMSGALSPPTAIGASGPSAHGFWENAKLQPNRLNARQTNWLQGSEFYGAILDAKAARQAKLGSNGPSPEIKYLIMV